MNRPNNIVLVGFMGTGKTTVGKLLATQLKWSYVDTDELIEKKTGLNISDIFSQQGEPYFRDIESKVIEEVMLKNHRIISTGGGMVIREQNIITIKSNGIMICLTATPEMIIERTKSDSHRPLLRVDNPKKRIQELMDKRSPYYAKADITIDTTDLSPDEIVIQIMKVIGKE
jgi:shikimate kinase